MHKKKVTVDPLAPFVFDPTFHKPDHFTTGDNFWEKGIKWQTWNWRGERIGVKFIDAGSVEQPKIDVEVYSGKKLSDKFVGSLIDEVKYLYNLDLDLSDFYGASRNNKLLDPIIKKWRGMRPGHPSSLYEYLIIGIVLQNATVKRSVQMHRALLEIYGTLLEYDEKKLWCFWEPGGLKDVSEEDLRALKMGYRAKYLKHVDNYFADKKINEYGMRKAGRETQMEELLKIYGVGPATVWYLLFDIYHHWNFMNHISPWEQKIYSKLFFNRNTTDPVPVDKLLKYFERFGKYKQLAIHYIWEDLWWKRKHEHIPWLEKEIRL